MVLAQHAELEFRLGIVPSFHPTMVLAQPDDKSSLFPPESVSIPLWFSLNVYQVSQGLHLFPVSIPLWFSLNKKARNTRNQLYSFHPTMVLAQQIRAAIPGRENSCFHPTMVLAQRAKNVIGIGTARFHPTLVLAQQNDKIDCQHIS